MNESVSITTDLLNKIRGFCNVFASQCKECLRRSPFNCAECHLVNRAKDIIHDIDNLSAIKETIYWINDPNEEIYARIERAIVQAGKPLYAKQIRLSGVYKQKKFWAIRNLVKRGRLVARMGRNGYSIFSLNPRRAKSK